MPINSIFVYDPYDLLDLILKKNKHTNLKIIKNISENETILHKPNLNLIFFALIDLSIVDSTLILENIKKSNPSILIFIVTFHTNKLLVEKLEKEYQFNFIQANSKFKNLLETLKINNYQNPKQVILNFFSIDKNLNFNKLTKRELEILHQIVKGKSNNEIAKELFLSSRTIDTHRTNIMRKLNINSVVDLIHYAYQNELITNQK